MARPEIAVGSVRSKQPINPILRVAWMEFRLMNRNRFLTSVFCLLSSHTKLTSIHAPATTARTLVQRSGLERWLFFRIEVESVSAFTDLARMFPLECDIPAKH